MQTQSDEVSTFLRNTRTTEGRELEVAIVYAELMVEALRASVAEWEAAAVRLQNLKQNRPPPSCN
jgi:hypothetical protein